ncbi:MAG TPA: AraC family transcriptional regulator [Cyanobacteria bacterium UBA11149]|nr:AraC family transcriptional regulator [Cyanobacteria bacterium UBA11367]HBE60712.1 AraC family transcriptional regulator [Cyanobacteria bacterium UBA11366]HBK64029.1 AraC family transcriptional regulator [Cyanobacteria bacterium UBA11166]HBR74490.1 AraC family transcriptional regulator [Cyanobacteria bacterium UBA11159]HBS68288.1 AraC family transcriptional regulator [Cyanobacteria bacterium UBA11153]HBW91371.1 AraC family transcriptional regulator [Cyanobacteria bacterium UBA11149]HCA9359
MGWNLNIEITEPEQYLQQMPTIGKHIVYSKEYRIQWQLARLNNFDLLSVKWEAGSTYTEGYTPPGKIVFTFFEGNHLFKVGSREILINEGHLCIGDKGIEHVRIKHAPSYNALSIYLDESRYLTELSKYLDKPMEHLKLVQTLDRTSLYGSSLYQMVVTLWNLIEINGHPIAIANLEIAIFSTLVQGPFYISSPNPVTNISEVSISRVREAADYIRANQKKNLTIPDIAQAMGCSSRSLQAAFARHYGYSPHQFLRTCRLESAHIELLNGKKTITEIALEYGFSNPGRFAKYFQEHFGKKPSDIFRKK